MTDKERIAAALQVSSYGQIDGGHHKTWVIDQMVRALLGCPEIHDGEFGTNDEYEKFVREYCDGEDGPDTYGWDTGIAP